MLKSKSESNSLVVTIDLAQMFANESKQTKLEALRIATQAQRTTAWTPLIRSGLRLIWWLGLSVALAIPAGDGRTSPNDMNAIEQGQATPPIGTKLSQ